MAKQLPAQNPIAPAPPDEDHVYASVRNTLAHARSHVERAVSSTMVETYEENAALLSGAPNSRHTVS